MDIFDIFAAASFEYAVYSNLAATDLCRFRIQTYGVVAHVEIKGCCICKPF